jgi:cell division protein ZapA
MGDRPDTAAVTPVTIFGRTYHLRGSEDPAYLEKLAAVVDRKMREVADGSGTADTLKVAILASLNIADDYLEARRPRSGARGAPEGKDEEHLETDRRVARMVAALGQALEA